MISDFKNLNVNYNTFYIAGASSRSIYLGNYEATTMLMISNFGLTDTQYVNLHTSVKGKIAWKAILIKVDSPDIYMFEGITPTMLRGDLSSLLMNDHDRINNIHFSELIPISCSSFAVRRYNAPIQQNVLSKITLKSHSLIDAKKALTKQIDGMFSTDGMLNYQPGNNYLIYTYFYRNEFICLDTDLNIIYKGKTIDTISQARIKIDTIKDSHTITFSAPPFIVNKRSCIYDNYLFVNSGLMANNEEEGNFRNNSVIDIYDLKKRRYKFSFYLPDFKGKKISDFQVYDTMVIVLYGNYLATCRLNFTY